MPARTLLAGAVVIFWIAAAAVGMSLMMRFNTTAGTAFAAPETWPAQSKLPFQFGRIHLIMLAHPQCPCTRASLAELAEILGRSDGRVKAYVLFYRPSQLPAEWNDDRLVRIAREIPGVAIIDDILGAEAARFGAMTSGHTLLYDAAGNLAFSGGITRARGEAGENPGRQAILQALREAAETAAHTPVFGCPLHGGGEDGQICIK